MKLHNRITTLIHILMGFGPIRAFVEKLFLCI